MTTQLFRGRSFGFGILFVIVLLTGACSAAEVKWSQDIERSLQEATTAGKPVLIEFTASWCVYCKRMEKSTFADAELADRINTQFVPVQIDADKHRDLVKQLEIKGLPAMLVVAPDLTIIDRISGFQTTEALTARLDQVSFTAAPQLEIGTAQVQGPLDADSTTPESHSGRAAVRSSTNPFAEPVESEPAEAVATSSPASAAPASAAPASAAPASAAPASAAPEVTRDEIPRLDLFGDVARTAATTPAATSIPAPSPAAPPQADPNPFAEVSSEETNPFAFVEEQAAPNPSPAAPKTVGASANPFADIEASNSTNPFAQPHSPAGTPPSDNVRSVSRTLPSKETDSESNAAPTAAFLGVCVVTAVDDHEIAAGSAAVQANYRGRVLHFRGEAQKAKFLASPDRYWPMLDGVCPVTLGETGKKICGDFQYAAVFRKRIWLFTSEETMRTFLDEPAEAVEEALERL